MALTESGFGLELSGLDVASLDEASRCDLLDARRLLYRATVAA